MSTTIRFGDEGIPAFGTDSFTNIELYSGKPSDDEPTVHPLDAVTVAAAALPAFAVVGMGAGGIALAKYDKSVQALGITVSPIPMGAGGGSQIAIFRDGVFNPAALTWDASFDTDAKKLAAFDGAPTPTHIVIKKRLY